jgi:hypothetical protein
MKKNSSGKVKEGVIHTGHQPSVKQLLVFREE